MPRVTEARPPRAKTPSEAIDYLADFSNLLPAGETLSAISGTDALGTALGAFPDDATITVDQLLINPTEITYDGLTVAALHGVYFRSYGGTAGRTYRVGIRASTSSGETRELVCVIRCEKTTS